MDVKLVISLFCAYLTTVAGNIQASQRFQANQFLDMLGKSFDPNVAYLDLLTELTQRLKIDMPGGTTNTTPKTGVISDKHACLDAPSKKGASITYTSKVHVAGSRAYYQCDTGYDGTSKFIYCTEGGQWSSISDWQGCVAVDCGPIPPNVQNADPHFISSTYGSVVHYSCANGYKMDRPKSNVTCTETGFWEKPTFSCEKASTPSLHLPSLQKAFNKNIGVDKIQQLQQLATTLIEAGPSTSGPKTDKLMTSQAAPIMPNPMMEAFFKSMQAFQGLTTASQTTTKTPATALASFNNNPMAAYLAQMFSNFSPPPPQTTTTTVAPPMKSSFGFQLPTHLQSLIPNGLPNAAGIKPQDLMTLASMGLGSSNAATAPRDINQLLGTMNPMSFFGGGMGLGGGGQRGGGAAAAGAGGPEAAGPMEPEKIAEQRQDMMMRAMMANAMKSMMAPATQQSGSATGTAATAAPANRNSGMDMLTLMALQSGLSGGSGGSGGGSGGTDPLSMLFGGLGGGGGGGSLLGNLFGAA